MPYKELEGRFGNREDEAAIPVSSKLLRNDELPDFALRLRGEWLEHNFFVEAPDEFGPKDTVKLGQNRALQRGEGQPGRT